MELTIKKVSKISPDDCIMLVSDGNTKWEQYGLLKDEISYIKSELKKETTIVALNQYSRWVLVYKVEEKNEHYKTLEACRKAGEKLIRNTNSIKIKSVTIADSSGLAEETLAFAEGVALGNYQFLKYKNEPEKEQNSLSSLGILSTQLSEKEIRTMTVLVDATYRARDLVNEPLITLSATELARQFQKMGKEAGFSVEVFNKAKIESLKMGGLLAVNAGSPDPPTFTVMEYKPKNAKNKKPIVLIGKGVVYDTGGLSLKPTLNSMDYMKSDMAGSAAVASSIYAIAKEALPVHVIGLVPATDNRPGGNAITPGDVITMHSGLTVEILNTDAEGRLILGDALSYAQKFKPELVIDLATLTGAALSAIGQYGIVCMGNADEKTKSQLKESGNRVYERLAEFPFWDEYDELIKSDIAEIKNVGGSYAGAITAGKFLEHFVDYPWMHFDIAGPSYLHKADSYRPKGGTGVGTRLLFDFIKTR